MKVLGYIFANDPSVIAFGMGMMFAFLVVFFWLFKNHPNEEKKLIVLSENDYKRLEEQTQESWKTILRNNRLHLAALTVCFGAQEFGEISHHHLFGNFSVISLVYLFGFLVSLRQLIRGKIIDTQVITNTIQGIKLETEHPEWEGYFHKFFRSITRFEMSILIFFRFIIPMWLVFCIIDFGFMDQLIHLLPVWCVYLSIAAILCLTALYLWKIGCQPYNLLRKKYKELASF